MSLQPQAAPLTIFHFEFSNDIFCVLGLFPTLSVNFLFSSVHSRHLSLHTPKCPCFPTFINCRDFKKELDSIHIDHLIFFAVPSTSALKTLDLNCRRTLTTAASSDNSHCKGNLSPLNGLLGRCLPLQVSRIYLDHSLSTAVGFHI